MRTFLKSPDTPAGAGNPTLQSEANQDGPAEVDYGRKWYVMAAVAMSIFLATIDGSIVNVALPTLTRDFGAAFAVVQWVVLVYLLTMTTLMLGIGRLADMRGKKPIYISGFVIFTFGSLLCALSPTVYWLIAFRVLQAVGAAMMIALGTAIITESFPPSERGRALGITGSMVSIGIVIGPTVGGLIIDLVSWHWIFLVNIPIGIAGAWMAWRFVPATKPPGGQRFDYWGALALFISLTSLLLGLTLGQQLGFRTPTVILLLAAWLIFLAIFLVIERRTAQPMIDLTLFRNAQFSINLGTGFIIFIAISGTFILMPFYLENVLGMPIRQVGLLLAVVPVAVGVTAPISGSLSDRFGSRRITVIGLAIVLLGFLAVSTLAVDTSRLGYALRMLPVGIGLGVFQSPNNSAIMGAVPRARLGVASGLLSINRTLGQITGIAIMGAIWASQVMGYAGSTGDATLAAPADQVAGLHDTLRVTVALAVIALALGLWGLVIDRRRTQPRGYVEPATH